MITGVLTGTRSAFCSWLLTNVPSPICLCKPFSCKACPGKMTTPAQRQAAEGLDMSQSKKSRFPSRSLIPGHALHEKGLQRQIGVGTLLSSQKRRALFVPRFNRTFCSSTGLHRISFVRAFEESFRRVVFGTLLGTRDRCPLGGPNRRRSFRPGPAWPRRRAVDRPAPTRPWYVRVLDSTGL